VLLILLLKQCEGPKDRGELSSYHKTGPIDTSYLNEKASPTPEKTVKPIDTIAEITQLPPDTASIDTVDKLGLEFAGDKVENEGDFIDTLFVYADPWGGRHFDSVVVEIICRENCLLLYAFGDSLNLKSYRKPLVIKSDKSLWIAGINENGQQSKPIKVKYFIKRKKGRCPENMMPFTIRKENFCMDIFEWPNLRGEFPKSFVKQREAAGLCHSVGKRLCSIEEWQTVCRGPDNLKFPYGNHYGENFCPAKEKKIQRAGRYPACRSYFGVFDMSGNVWEWTGSESDLKEGHYWVAGGNWEAGNQGTCKEKKYSFYPQNKYPFVGFRCCKGI